jgi:hypothetical protein
MRQDGTIVVSAAKIRIEEVIADEAVQNSQLPHDFLESWKPRRLYRLAIV